MKPNLSNYGTTDAIHNAQLLMETDPVTCPLYISTGVAHKLIWYDLRQNLLSEEFVRRVKLLYRDQCE